MITKLKKTLRSNKFTFHISRFLLTLFQDLYLFILNIFSKSYYYQKLQHTFFGYIYRTIYRTHKNDYSKLFWYSFIALKKNVKNFYSNNTNIFIKEMIAFHIEKNTSNWWDNILNLNYYTFPDFNRNLNLRKAGDTAKFIEFEKKYIENSIFIEDNQNYYLELSQYFIKNIANINACIKNKEIQSYKSKINFLIAFSCWGESYLDSFLRFCLPSLLANGNLPFLAKNRNVIINIHTDLNGETKLKSSKIIKDLKKLDIHVKYQILNKNLLKTISLDLNNRYWHIGMTQSLDLYLAKKLNADFHLLMPDTIYSDMHFSGIINAVDRGNEVITSLGLSTIKEKIILEIEKYRDKKNKIVIPTCDLASLSINNIHPASESWISTNCDNATELPNLFMIAWEAEKSIHIMSPHQTILFLSRNVTKNIPTRLFMSLDSELDAIIPKNIRTYLPQKQDEIFLVEMTSVKQVRYVGNKKNSISEFCRQFWAASQNSRGYLRFCESDAQIPLNRAMLIDRDFMSDQDIVNKKLTLLDSIVESYPFPNIKENERALKYIKDILLDKSYKNIFFKANKVKRELELQILMMKKFKKFNSIWFPAELLSNKDKLNFRKQYQLIIDLKKQVPGSELFVARILSRYDSMINTKYYYSFRNEPGLADYRLKRQRQNLILSKKNTIIESLLIEAINICVKNNIQGWSEYLNAPETVYCLKLFIKEFILRRLGDYKKYLEIIDKLETYNKNEKNKNDDEEQCLVQMIRYFSIVVGKINDGLLYKNSLDSEKKNIILGVSCWGKDYLNTFTSYCLPSLMSEGNLLELIKFRKVIIFIQTDKEGKNYLLKSKIIKKIENLGIDVVYNLLDKNFSNYISRYTNLVYWHLGMCQSLEWNFAKKLKADYHLLMPDTIYSSNHFAGLVNLVKKGQKAITRVIPSSKKNEVCNKIENYRSKEGVISVPAPDLASLSILYIGSRVEEWVVTSKDIEKDIGIQPVVLFEAEDHIKIYSAHQTILYLADDIIASYQNRFFLTLDSELDKLIPKECPIYSPKKEDEIFLIEITAENNSEKKHVSNDIRGISKFNTSFWYSCQKSMSYFRFFENPTIDPINRSMIKRKPFLKEKEINYKVGILKNYLKDNYPVQTSKEFNQEKKLISLFK